MTASEQEELEEIMKELSGTSDTLAGSISKLNGNWSDTVGVIKAVKAEIESLTTAQKNLALEQSTIAF